MLRKRLNELLEFAASTDLEEVVWEKDGAHVSFRRSGVSPKLTRAQTEASASAAPASNAPAAKAPESLTIKSTMVGTFFRSDSPDRPPLVVEGTLVAGGQSVAAIEAMKIMKDVIAPTPCRIVKALIANGHPVEYGQPLFEIELPPEEPANV